MDQKALVHIVWLGASFVVGGCLSALLIVVIMGKSDCHLSVMQDRSPARWVTSSNGFRLQLSAAHEQELLAKFSNSKSLNCVKEILVSRPDAIQTVVFVLVEHGHLSANDIEVISSNYREEVFAEGFIEHAMYRAREGQDLMNRPNSDDSRLNVGAGERP